MAGDNDRNSGGNSDGRDSRGRFAKGNPGKPKGSRHRATKAVEGLLDGRAEELTEKAVELALDGDTTALRLCLERVAPARKDAPVSVDLPAIKGGADLLAASAAVVEAAANGDISPSEARAIGDLIQGHARVVETHEILERIARLEEKNQ
ncbi:MAG: hypothetical protein AAFW98_14870 [Pseudomonadota bacterium]